MIKKSIITILLLTTVFKVGLADLEHRYDGFTVFEIQETQ